MKYDTNGTLVWSQIYGIGNNRDDEGKGIALDSVGNIYISGHAWSDASFSTDYLVIKYGPDGNQLWSRTYDSGKGHDYARGIAVDASGNAYVNGQVPSLSNGYDSLIVKFDSAGNVIWSKIYDNGKQNYGRGIAVGQDGSLYEEERSWTGSNWDYLTIKYDSSGNPLWTRIYDRGGHDESNSIAVDESGNVSVTGRSWSNTLWNYEFLTLRYNTNGNLLWNRPFNLGPWSGNEARSVAVDINGNTYVAGHAAIAGDPADFIIFKYGPAGDIVWAKGYDAGVNERAHGIATDGEGDVYVTGISLDGQNYGLITIKYTETLRTGHLI